MTQNVEDNSLVMRGRRLLIQQTLDELDPADRAILIAIADEISTQVTVRGMRRGMNVRFSTTDALELLWEFLIFQDDPGGRSRSLKLASYEAFARRLRHED